MKVNINNIVNFNTTTAFITLENTGCGYFIQNITNEQNIDKFVKGLGIISNMNGKRGEFLRHFISHMALPMTLLNNEAITKITFGNERYCNFVAFICDLANQNELKNWDKVYDKVYAKFVANLCYNYYLDEDFETFKNGGEPQYNHYPKVIIL